MKIKLDEELKNTPTENNSANGDESGDAEDKSEKNSALTTKDAIPDCPIDLQIPGGYGMDEYGIFCNCKQICKTPVVITGILRESDTKNTFTRISYYNQLEKRWHDEIFADGIIADKRKILALADKGINFNSQTAKELCNYLLELKTSQKNAIRIPRIVVFRQPGWHELNSKENFIYGNDADGKYILRREGWQYGDIFKQKGSRAVQLETLKKVAEKNTAARLLIGAALLSPLVKLAMLPNVQVHIHGRRNIGKSPLLKFCASLFGNPREYVKTFNSSLKNLEESSAGFKDLPVVVDELESLNEREPATALSNFIYNFFEGVTRQVQKRNGTPREVYRFQGCRITNGEQNIIKPHMKSGAFKRVLSIRRDSLFDDKFSRELHRTVEKNYGFLGIEWIDLLNSDAGKKIIENFQYEYGEFESVITDEDEGKHESTHIQALVASLLAFYKFSEFIGAKSDDAYNIENDIRAVLDELPTSEEIDDTNRAIDFLRDFILSHEKNFHTVTRNASNPNCDGAYPNGAPPLLTDCYGFIGTDDSVYCYPSSLRTILEDEGGFSSADKLFNEWRNEGKIICNKGRGFTRLMTLPTGNRQGMIDFKPGVLIETEKNYKRRQDKVEDDESDDYADDGYSILDGKNSHGIPAIT